MPASGLLSREGRSLCRIVSMRLAGVVQGAVGRLSYVGHFAGSCITIEAHGRGIGLSLESRVARPGLLEITTTACSGPTHGIISLASVLTTACEVHGPGCRLLQHGSVCESKVSQVIEKRSESGCPGRITGVLPMAFVHYRKSNMLV